MNIKKLHLEITRNCTLACEHCLRGDAEHVNMSLETIDNVFKDIDRIDYLLLTGGEPLIAVRQLERIIEIIKSGKVTIDNIGIVTNGTVMSARILRILKELNELSTLRISISGDIFHRLEIERLGFYDKRVENEKILYSYFMTNVYVSEDSWDSLNVTYDAIGRAKNLTQERLAEINRMSSNKYRISDYYIGEERPCVITGDSVYDTVTVNVYGNLVTSSRDYVYEDEESKRYDANVNSKVLTLALKSYNKYIESKRKK